MQKQTSGSRHSLSYTKLLIVLICVIGLVGCVIPSETSAAVTSAQPSESVQSAEGDEEQEMESSSETEAEESTTSSNFTEDLEFEQVSVSLEGPVLLFRIDSPPMNGVSVLVLNALNEVMDMIEEGGDVRAIVITGTGEVFSDSAGGTTVDPPNGMTHSLYAQTTFDRMETFPVPIVAAINGKAGQGGLELAMASDIRIASSEATFSQWEVLVGLIPGFGGIQRLPRLVGHGLATDMMITGRILNSEEALTAGLISRVSTPEDILSDGIALGQELAEIVPTSSLTVLKERLVASHSETFSEAANNDHLAFDSMFGSPEAEAAVQKFIERMQAQQSQD